MTAVLSTADWLDTDEHRDQAWNLHQRITAQHGPYIAAAWLIGASPRPTHHGHSADVRAAAHAHLDH
ncbi:hypothetical protein [Streptomyces angustmyceticus]|uniref:hypothetical protein n=1 Tax=Streptomyces angustmyceticus TaxID=285578 RepID=UPI00344E2C73